MNKRDLGVVRDLAKRVREISELPVQRERARLWKACNSLNPERPMVLATQQPMGELEAAWIDCQCEDERLMGYEAELRRTIMHHEYIPDDYPIIGSWIVPIPVLNGGYDDYGFELRKTDPENPDGAYHIEPVITSEHDIDRLHFRPLAVDHVRADAAVLHAEEILGDLLKVEKRGKNYWRYGLSRVLIHMRGLERMMLDMYDNPSILHRLMAFLRDDFMQEIDILEGEAAVSFNNGPAMLGGSGGLVDNNDLPEKGYGGAPNVANSICWAESQETVGVGPDQFDEFVLRYQLPLVKRFGLTDYGCCEALDYKLDLLVEKIPNLRWISVSPWADRRMCAEKIAGNYVYVYKPNPAYICAKQPDWESAEKDIRDTAAIVDGAPMHICMKDTKTFWGDAGRTTQWCEMAVRIAEEMS